MIIYLQLNFPFRFKPVVLISDGLSKKKKNNLKTKYFQNTIVIKFIRQLQKEKNIKKKEKRTKGIFRILPILKKKK